ncbi:hypothetical protein BDV25DRAFT_141581 [Aspergillus avenaceus]|uniref:Uncharacterized protein n=1 Tax=Aspergillus avenaceus TaxID=36643 RepID=A0A5N6TQJ3_ASPAV|nr:hypothetical protein BDV25DRAFT_141581 [Aspergillus avenaceus]
MSENTAFSPQLYSRSHTWRYHQGAWKEPREVPEGAGAPVGTECHWLTVAHQFVKKIDASTHETNLSGSKYKLVYKSASLKSWSVKGQRKREVELLNDANERVQGLAPVLASEKVKVDRCKKGRQELDNVFSKIANSDCKKRKLSDESVG